MLAEVDSRPLSPILRQELAKRRLLDFGDLVYAGFQRPKHIEFIAGLLEQVERGELRKLMINVPVRHGKSVLCSQVFPAWFLGRNPRKDVILSSHSEDLATRNSRVARSLLQDDRWPFPGVKLATDSNSASRWNTTAGGGVYAIGVGGNVTGRGANVFIVDDALHDALSEAERESAWLWYSEVAVPRLEPGGASIMIGARFAEDDLCGRILNSADGKNWKVVNFPALAEEDDPLGREVGEALWPERMPVEEIEMQRISMSGRAFNAQFMQQPVSAKGGIFRRSWFESRWTNLPEPEPSNSDPATERRMLAAMGFRDPLASAMPRRFVKIQAVDTASKTGSLNDWSVITTLVFDGISYYVVDVARAKCEFPELTRLVQDEYEKHRPSHVFVEDASAGTALLQALRKFSRVPVIPVPVGRSSKTARAESVSPYFESGRVLFPTHASWLDDLIDEHCSFPGRHDDFVDSLGLAITMAGKVAARRLENANSLRTLSGWIAR